MRLFLLSALLWFSSHLAALAHDIRWPNADIPVPPLVHQYIVAECNSYRGFSDESVQACITAERYGYRAVVTMLTDREQGDFFAGRYRGCAAGLGDFGGRFHRRRAECMSCVLRITWRFEFMQRASLGSGAVIAPRDET